MFERFRAVLHEGEIEKRVQFVIEGLFAVRKAGFEKSGFPAVKPELDLVDAGGSLLDADAWWRCGGVVVPMLGADVVVPMLGADAACWLRVLVMWWK